MNSADPNVLIVDNSDDNWKALKYLEEWCHISSQFDIATAFFEIGSLLALDGKWQKLGKIRILMGEEVSLRTQKAFIDAVARKVNILNQSIEWEKNENDFLDGVESIVEAIANGQIECRVYRKDKFHAKAYITHADNKIIGSSALVGSSNFTRPGLTSNIELNVQLRREVEILQNWYETHWNESEDVSPDILQVMRRQIAKYQPLDIYLKSLSEFFKNHEATASEWENLDISEGGSKIFKVLNRYQREGYRSMMEIVRNHRGAFCCDGVGLGKTFIGLMLIERLVFFEKKNVVLIVPKSTRKDVWEKTLEKFLPDLRGAYINLQILNHTDFNRSGDFPSIINSITDRADAVIIDEAHNFRNKGSQGNDEKPRSRYWKLFDLIEKKECFFLTATPINNRLADFRNLVELFSRGEESYFAKRLGIQSLKGHFIKLEKQILELYDSQGTYLETNIEEAKELLSIDQLFSKLVVQRSRGYVKKSQEKENSAQILFPKKADPVVADYSIKKTYGKLLKMIEEAFNKNEPLFILGIYFPISYEILPESSKHSSENEKMEKAFAENRQRQVVSLIRTQFLKRFESSAHSFQRSCDRLLLKLLSWVTKFSTEKSQELQLETWRRKNEKALDLVHNRQLEFDFLGDVHEEDFEEDVITPDMLENIEDLDPEKYDIDRMLNDAFLDLDQLVKFLDELKKLKPKSDDKLRELIRLLKNDSVMKRQKVLIFTEYAETALYLTKQLSQAGINDIECVHGSSGKNRSEIVERFSPFYNGSSSELLKESGKKEVRVLIATDVLSEGLNLQDATRIINYDIHWNPVRLMQRIGRIDRRLNPDLEDQIVKFHPDQKSIRGKISILNFLPPEELDELIQLYEKVSRKTLRISKTLGIEGKKLLTPQDEFDALKDFNEKCEGKLSAEELMHLEFQNLLANDPNLEVKIPLLPERVYSGKSNIIDSSKYIFFCYRIPGPPKESDEYQVWSLNNGTTHWVLYNFESNTIQENPAEIVNIIRSDKNTQRVCNFEKQDLRDVRLKVEKLLENNYLRKIQAPIGVKLHLKAWMELN